MNLSAQRCGPRDESAWLAETSGATSTAIALQDWSTTPLGPMDEWPQSLRTALGICLGSRFPMALWWGNDLIQLYNDAYRHILGEKHPRSLGQNAAACWSEIWSTVGPMAARAIATGEATWFEDLLLVINRYGYIEEAYFTVSFSSVRDESGAVAGVLMSCVETTERVLGERRLATLRDLAAHSGDGKTAEEACIIAANILAANPFDVPFALIYLADAPAQVARLAGVVRLPHASAAAPAVVALAQDDGAPAPLAGGRSTALGAAGGRSADGGTSEQPSRRPLAGSAAVRSGRSGDRGLSGVRRGTRDRHQPAPHFGRSLPGILRSAGPPDRHFGDPCARLRGRTAARRSARRDRSAQSGVFGQHEP